MVLVMLFVQQGVHAKDDGPWHSQIRHIPAPATDDTVIGLLGAHAMPDGHLCNTTEYCRLWQGALARFNAAREDFGQFGTAFRRWINIVK